MARVDQAFAQADPAIGLMQHQVIRLADAILEHRQQDGGENDDANDNFQDDIHMQLLRVGLVHV